MVFSPGDRVRVNLAPFIGAAAKSDQWIACEVLAVEPDRLLVVPELPYRRVELWVDAKWVKPSRRAVVA